MDCTRDTVALLERLHGEVVSVDAVGPAVIPDALMLIAHTREHVEAAIANGDLEPTYALKLAGYELTQASTELVRKTAELERAARSDVERIPADEQRAATRDLRAYTALANTLTELYGTLTRFLAGAGL